jgi:thiamine kinase-like enzyme
VDVPLLFARALGLDTSKLRITPIAAGLTNKNYRLDLGDKSYFFRRPGPTTELLAVDRANELYNTRAAAKAGVGPRVLQHDAKTGGILLEWLPGRTMSNEAFQAPGMPVRIAEALRRLHAGPRFRDDFDMFRLSEHYLRVVDDRSIRIPDGYRDELPKVALIEAALAAHPLPTVPCHNDLLAENYLDDGRKLWIVDYEYSGNNDPTFELGNTAQELGFDDARQEELCAAYFGEVTPALLARMRLQMIMSDVGWTLWAAIQAAISSIDYDFWGWAEERWGRASTAFQRDDFDDLLAEVVAG